MTQRHYSILQVSLHWIMALLFAANYLVSYEMEKLFHRYLDGAPINSDWTASFHIFFGITFILLAVIRLAIRSNHKTPEMAVSSNPIVKRLTLYLHNGLYLLMFLVPIAGMSALYVKVKLLGDIHILLMNLMLAIISLHIISSLYHQFILKDNLLKRMSILKR